jgi:uncharacterized iron-regulated protein
MNALQLLKTKMSSQPNKPQINWVEVNIPFNLKDTCRIKFKGQIKWDGDINSWCADETIADKFSKVFLEEYVNPTKDEKLILKNSGANYDKETKLYYFLKYQTEEIVEPQTDEDV